MDYDLEKNAAALVKQLVVLPKEKAAKHLKTLSEMDYTLYCKVRELLQKEGFPFSG